MVLFHVPNDMAPKDIFLYHGLVEDVVDGWWGNHADAAAKDEDNDDDVDDAEEGIHQAY